jgi:hypothetical protein
MKIYMPEEIRVVTVVPDSGADQLEGLPGQMMIQISDGKHFYDFERAVVEAT